MLMPGVPRRTAYAWPSTKTMPVLADAGYDGAGRGVLTPTKQRTDGPHCTPTSTPTTSSRENCAASANAA